MIQNVCYIIGIVTPALNYYTNNIINMKGITFNKWHYCRMNIFYQYMVKNKSLELKAYELSNSWDFLTIGIINYHIILWRTQ